MSLFRTTPDPDRPPPINHAETLAMAALAHRVRLDLLGAIVDAALAAQAARAVHERNRELIDLCLDLRNALSPMAEVHVPVIPGRT